MVTEVRSEITVHLPAEWHEQSAILLTWPHANSIWAETLDEIDAVFVNATKEISKYQKVIISCYNQTHLQHIRNLLENAKVDIDKIRLYKVYSNDIWVRDHGPISILQDSKLVLLDFTFNGWGNKYPAEYDNHVTKSLHDNYAFANTKVHKVDLVLEGGSIESDGAGTLLTTSRCLLARNPTLTQDFLNLRLKQLFGVKRILWLEHGYLSGDDTDGHIDTLARFVNANTICYVSCDDPNDENYQSLQLMEDQLQTFTDAEGKNYNLIALPSPKPRYAKYDGRRLPLSYANFLIINDAVLVPTFDDEADDKAIAIIHGQFSHRKVIGINCSAVVEWYGAIHCFTMQILKG